MTAVPAVAGAAAGPAGAAGTADWPGYLGGAPHDSDNAAATTITPAAVPGLTRVWQWVPAAPTMAGQPQPTLFASPTVVGGRVYIGANTGVFYALDAATGTVLWHRFLGFVPKKTCGSRGILSTATVTTDPSTGKLTVYVAGGGGYLYALDAATGATVWRSVVAIPSATKSDYYNWASPVVTGGRVFMGVSSQCDNPLVMGGLKSYNQETGALEDFYQTNPGGTTGPSIWSSPAAPSSGQAIYVTTGNGVKGSDAVAMVRLDPATLAKVNMWQVPASEQGADSDFGASPTLFPATIGGKTVQLIGACDKNGVYYVLRRGNLAAGVVWQLTVGTPADHSNECDAAAPWDGSSLYVSSNGTTIGGVSYAGAIRSLNAATGSPNWQTGLAGPVIGSPSLDGGGVLAVPTYASSGLYLIDAATGAILRRINTDAEFGQPVFAGGMLLIPTQNHGLWAYQPAARGAR